MAVDLLLQHAQTIADAHQLLQEGLDRDLLALAFAAGHELQHAARPPLAELEIDVEPAVIAEHGPDGLRDAIELRVAGTLLGIQPVEAERDRLGVAAGKDDDVAIVVVGDDAPAAEVAVTHDRAQAEARTLGHVPIPSSSTSKMSVAPGGMTPPAPRSPYARLAGITSLRLPPTFIEPTPSSQPLMT
jgi:hypothetical protein